MAMLLPGLPGGILTLLYSDDGVWAFCPLRLKNSRKLS